jgi:hemerythrin
MAIRWTPALSVGIEEIDEQHRELFARAARFAEAAAAGRSAVELSELLDFLHAYAVWHFGLEEAWMRDAAYQGYAAHKAEHDRFAEDILDLAEEHERSGPGVFLAHRVEQWLAAWLERHVSATDAEMGQFLGRRAG